MTKAEKRVVRAAMRLYHSIQKRGFANTNGTRTGLSFCKACAALSRKDKR